MHWPKASAWLVVQLTDTDFYTMIGYLCSSALHTVYWCTLCTVYFEYEHIININSNNKFLLILFIFGRSVVNNSKWTFRIRHQSQPCIITKDCESLTCILLASWTEYLLFYMSNRLAWLGWPTSAGGRIWTIICEWCMQHKFKFI